MSPTIKPITRDGSRTRMDSRESGGSCDHPLKAPTIKEGGLALYLGPKGSEEKEIKAFPGDDDPAGRREETPLNPELTSLIPQDPDSHRTFGVLGSSPQQQILEAGLTLEPYEWYLDLRRCGTVKHSGFGLGFERMVPFPKIPREG